MTATTPESGPAAGFALDAAWRLHPQAAVRPEPFGALLYHFGTRRLSFLKDPALAAAVAALADHPTARSALAAAGLAPAGGGETTAGPGSRARAALSALATLAATGMIVERPPS